LNFSEERDTPTLGLIEGRVLRFAFDDPALKIPHMGWNAVRKLRPHPVLEALNEGDEFYFVHAYYPQPDDPAEIYAETEYEGTFACAVGRNNYFATQFHPEKSGRVGLELLSCFARWDGSVDAQ
jgi:glutamine amidotransferase